MFHPCIGGAKEVVEDSRHGIMIRCKDAAREREKINATGIEVGFLNGRIPKETLKAGTLGTSVGVLSSERERFVVEALYQDYYCVRVGGP